MKIIQFKYYSDNNTSNYPSASSLASWKDGTAFASQKLDTRQVYHLGVQGLPGAEISFGESKIVLGANGYFSFDFDKPIVLDGLKVIPIITEKENAIISYPLLIDIVYEGE